MEKHINLAADPAFINLFTGEVTYNFKELKHSIHQDFAWTSKKKQIPFWVLGWFPYKLKERAEFCYFWVEYKIKYLLR